MLAVILALLKSCVIFIECRRTKKTSFRNFVPSFKGITFAVDEVSVCKPVILKCVSAISPIDNHRIINFNYLIIITILII